MTSNGSDAVRGNVDGLFTSQLLACQALLELPRAGRGPDFPGHLQFITRAFLSIGTFNRYTELYIPWSKKDR